jgi:hypothetical protein
MEFLLETKKDKLVFRKNTMLKPAARDLVMAVAASQPLSEPTSFKPGQSTVIVRLTWEGDTDLDLLVTDTDGNLLGAGKGNLYLATGEETAFVQVEEGGRWEVSVVCGADGGCPTTKASVSIKAADAKETIPVLLKGSVGTEVARIIVKQKQVVSSSTYNVMPGVSTRARPDKNEIIALLKPLVPKVKACAQGVEGVVKVSITFMGSTGKISPASVSGGPELTPAQKSCIESVVLKAGKLEPFEDAKLKVVFPFALK